MVYTLSFSVSKFTVQHPAQYHTLRPTIWSSSHLKEPGLWKACISFSKFSSVVWDTPGSTMHLVRVPPSCTGIAWAPAPFLLFRATTLFPNVELIRCLQRTLSLIPLWLSTVCGQSSVARRYPSEQITLTIQCGALLADSHKICLPE
jgi:hypothetical protein